MAKLAIALWITSVVAYGVASDHASIRLLARITTRLAAPYGEIHTSPFSLSRDVTARN